MQRHHKRLRHEHLDDRGVHTHTQQEDTNVRLTIGRDAQMALEHRGGRGRERERLSTDLADRGEQARLALLVVLLCNLRMSARQE
eukprot:6045611-Prymnesium_polylepis.1